MSKNKSCFSFAFAMQSFSSAANKLKATLAPCLHLTL
ncbi:MAG: hypothetical protein ACI86M_003207, partial [Saprospiraceae bacterium]